MLTGDSPQTAAAIASDDRAAARSRLYGPARASDRPGLTTGQRLA
jgi:hypothetical protein